MRYVKKKLDLQMSYNDASVIGVAFFQLFPYTRDVALSMFKMPAASVFQRIVFTNPTLSTSNAPKFTFRRTPKSGFRRTQTVLAESNSDHHHFCSKTEFFVILWFFFSAAVHTLQIVDLEVPSRFVQEFLFT